MKHQIVAVLMAAGTVLMLSSCAAKQQNAHSLSSIKEAQYVHILIDETDATRQLLQNQGFNEEQVYENAVLIDESILPLPDLDIYNTFFYTQDAGSDSEFYEEFNEFNVPMAMTARVSAYIKYFTERIPDTTQNWLNRANKYMYLVQDIFIKEGLPTDLVVLGFTESGYNTHAISVAGAAGMWQFIPSTGKIYGMENNFWVDERRDFEKSTYAAAKYLKLLHENFDDWYLALAAYNAGPGKISRATKKHATRDFFTISQNRYTLKLETRDYVPKFLALLIIYKNYLKYGFSAPSEMPLLYENVVTTSQTNLYWLAKGLEIEPGILEELNPALKLPMTPPKVEYTLRVPYGMAEMAQNIIDTATTDERAMYKIYNPKHGEKLADIASKYKVTVTSLKELNALVYSSVYAGRPIFVPIKDMRDTECDAKFNRHLSKLAAKYYVVKRGDTFIDIAHKHSMRLKDLQKLNPNINSSRIYVGQYIAVGEGVIPKAKTATKVNKSVKGPKYTVRNGDTLWSIAKKFGTTVDFIMTANNLNNEFIKPGKVLAVTR